MTQVHVLCAVILKSTGNALFRHWRAPGKLLKVGVADITQVIDTDFAGIESVGGKLAQEAEKLNSLPQTWILLRVLPISDQVENLFYMAKFQAQAEVFRCGSNQASLYSEGQAYKVSQTYRSAPRAAPHS